MQDLAEESGQFKSKEEWNNYLEYFAKKPKKSTADIHY